MTSQGLFRWVEQGIVETHGRGPRRAVLVSLDEVRRESEWRVNSVGQADASRLLRTEIRNVARLCASGELPSRQPAGPGGGVFILRTAVEQLAAERAAAAEQTAARFITTMAAAELAGWPHWVIVKLADEGRFKRHPGKQGALLIDREDLANLLDEFERSPSTCPVCGEPVPAGRRFHKGRCAFTIAREEWTRRRPEIIARKREELERVKSDNGLRSVEEVASDLKRESRVIWYHVWNHALGQVYPGPARTVLLNDADIAVVREHLSPHHDDPEFRGNWFFQRHGTRGEWGRHSKELADRKGTKVGRPSRWDDERLRSRLYELDDSGVSEEMIASLMGVSRSSVRNQLRHRRESEQASTESGQNP